MATVLLMIPFVVVSNAKEKAKLEEFLGQCREYINGLRMEMSRRELNTETDVKRIVELADDHFQ